MIDLEKVRVAAREVVAKMVGHKVEDSESIVSSGLIDSLSVLRLIGELEKALSIRIPPQTLQPEDFDNVDTIVETIERVSE